MSQDLQALRCGACSEPLPDAVTTCPFCGAEDSAVRPDGRRPDGTWGPGTSGCPTGMPKGTFSLTRAERKRLQDPPTERHRKAAADGTGTQEPDVPHFDCLGELMAWVQEVRALQGTDAAFNQIFDRVDPKPQKIDVAVGPPKRAAVPDGAPGDAEREAAEHFYDDLHGGDG